MRFDEVLRTWSEFFEKEGIRYAVAGGNAITAWGGQRPTHDVDFVVDGSDRDRMIAHAELLGYETTFVSEGFSNHYHANNDLGHIDFMYVYGDTASQLFADSVIRSVFGVPLPVLSPEHLIAMKIRAIKNRPMRVLIDTPDIEYLMSLPHVDKNRVREYFDRQGLLKIYDGLRKK